jgi:hypothetical protein
MAKIDLDSLGTEELANLRENAADKLFEKVTVRRARSRTGKTGQHGKPVKKAESAPAPKPKRPKKPKSRRNRSPRQRDWAA